VIDRAPICRAIEENLPQLRAAQAEFLVEPQQRQASSTRKPKSPRWAGLTARATLATPLSLI
jgi:hypothetical protein